MNTSNKLTIIRLLLILPFIIFMGIAIGMKSSTSSQFTYSNFLDGTIFFVLSGIIFIAAMITDFVDGFLARKKKQVTIFGKLFDPLADKFMTTSALVMLSIAKIVPFWIIIIFILRDILVDGSRNLAAANNVKVEASFWGKAKTLLMTIGIAIIFIIYPIIEDFGIYNINSWNSKLLLLNIPLMLAAILSVISGYKYFVKIIPYIKIK